MAIYGTVSDFLLSDPSYHMDINESYKRIFLSIVYNSGLIQGPQRHKSLVETLHPSHDNFFFSNFSSFVKVLFHRINSTESVTISLQAPTEVSDCLVWEFTKQLPYEIMCLSLFHNKKGD